jgi:glycosyltransferase involved in cell wall biosynthesis
MKSINKINTINLLQELQQHERGQRHKDYEYDLTINTNGDAAPYYHPSFSKDNTITYCHFPSTKYHIDSENIDYLKTDLGMIQSSNGFLDNTDYIGLISKELKGKVQYFSRKECFRIINYGYLNLMRNSILITNSEYSRRKILDALGLDKVYILTPPIDTKTFRNPLSLANGHSGKSDIILVIARIAPHKKLDNAIKLAKILKDNNTAKGMKIVGNLYHYFSDYYSELRQMVLDLGLTDYVTFEVNASLDRLLSIIKTCKVYFHPMVGEHFGMTVVEAISAGLIPVVPSDSGTAEFVPKKYQFNTIEQAAEIITCLLNQSQSNAKQTNIDIDINKFSNSHYIEGFKTILNKLQS